MKMTVINDEMSGVHAQNSDDVESVDGWMQGWAGMSKKDREGPGRTKKCRAALARWPTSG